jgi:hypothetical protein
VTTEKLEALIEVVGQVASDLATEATISKHVGMNGTSAQLLTLAAKLRDAAEVATTPLKTECGHPSVPTPEFDYIEANNLSASEVMQTYPRTEAVCPDCGENVIKYASAEHYLQGDW